MKYIYLDWNVIQYIKHGSIAEGRFDAVKFKSFLQELKGKFVFPASEGHLRDLSATFKKENPYIEEDISFLKDISEGLMLGVYNNESLKPVEADISSEFKEILQEKVAKPELSIEGGSYKVDMNKLSKNSLFRPFLEKNNGVLDKNVMEDFLQMVWDKIDDPDFYKSFRAEVEQLHKTFATQDTILNQQSAYFKRIEAFFAIGKIKDNDELKEKFELILSSFLAIDGRKLEDMTKGQKLECVYGLLDFSPLFRDKINKKNRPSNMSRDLKNLFYASDAKYYVTEDDATYKKSKFVVKFLDLPVKVVKMDELRLNLTFI